MFLQLVLRVFIQYSGYLHTTFWTLEEESMESIQQWNLFIFTKKRDRDLSHLHPYSAYQGLEGPSSYFF